MLVDGKIPANTKCPYAAICSIKAEGACRHLGIAHTVPFSCAVARGFQIIDERDSKKG